MKDTLKRTFVREEAYLRLRNWIVEGSLEAGAKLRDKDLAQELGVSRTPIREALLRLEDEGFVQTKPNRSTQVSPINFHNADHLYAIVQTLEQLAMSQAFEHITKEHLQKMSHANERLIQALRKKDQLLAMAADNEFHSTYIQLSQNQELINLLEGLKQKLTRLEIYYFDQVKDPQLSYEEHNNIIEAIRKKNLKTAMKELAMNWRIKFDLC